MQDRYAGDIGDFGKLLLLREIARTGLKVGVNWYYTPPVTNEVGCDGSFKRKDGRYRITDNLASADHALADTLREIYDGNPKRTVAALETADLIPGARYFRDNVPLVDRSRWFLESRDRLKECDLVFLDPDNGLLPRSVQERSPKSVKYVLPHEILEYRSAGMGILLYNHRPRRKVPECFTAAGDILQTAGVNTSSMESITFPRFTVRDYLFLPADDHQRETVLQCFNTLVNGRCGELGLCRFDWRPPTGD